MKLKQWRLKNNKTQEELAKDLGANQGMVQKWETETVRPSAEFMMKIMEVTGKEVQPNDFYEVKSDVLEQ